MNDLMTKSFMSYVDLKKEAMKDLEAGPDYDVEMAAAASKTDADMTLFLEEAEKVKNAMDLIRDGLVKLQAANEESKTLHKSASLKILHARISADITSVLKRARSVKISLEEMDRANEASRRLSNCKEGTPMYRTRIAVANGLRAKLKEMMMEFQDLRQRMMAEYKETVARRYYTVTGENPDEEVIERVISDGAEDFLQTAIQQHGRGAVVETVVEIQDRYDAAKEVEKSLLELHQVFLDMAVVVQSQGEKFDDIEEQVMSASHYVKDGTKELKSAKEYQRRSRKWMILAIILLLVIIFVIVVPIATSFSDS